MGNFTRSMLYSGAILVLGLVAVTAIYSNNQSQENGLAVIEPASGEVTETVTATEEAAPADAAVAVEGEVAPAVEGEVAPATEEAAPAGGVQGIIDAIVPSNEAPATEEAAPAVEGEAAPAEEAAPADAH